MGKPIVTAWSVPGILTSMPSASTSLTCGRTTLVEPRRLGSMTTSVDRPVTSSTCLATVTPSSTFSNFARPANSEMIGRVSGSQRASTVPALIDWSAMTPSFEPYGTLWRSRSRPCASATTISPEREMMTSSPLPDFEFNT